MPVFGKDKDKKDEKNQQGQQGQGGEGSGGEGKPKEPEYVTAEKLAELKGEFKGMLDTVTENINLQFRQFGQPQQRQPEQPKGPDVSEEIEKLDTQLAALDAPFEEAIRKGEGVMKIQKQRETLIQKRSDLLHKADMDELRTFGTHALDQLSERVVADKLEYLRIPEVKVAYDQALASMSPQQRTNPETRMLAYKFACGENMDKIFDLKMQEHLRRDEEEKKAATQSPTGTGGRTQEQDVSDPNYVPKPEDYLSPENLLAIRTAGKTVDSYYQSLGYKGGWEDFWKTDGREFFIGGEEETEQ